MVPNVNDSRPKLEVVAYATKTYRLDPQAKKIEGFTDGYEALLQRVYKGLQTDRYAHIIYDNYGLEFETLLGQDPDFVKEVLPDRIEEFLLLDSEILEVTSMDFIDGEDSDALIIQFELGTIYGRTGLLKSEIK